jgi:hypothetical protein
VEVSDAAEAVDVVVETVVVDAVVAVARADAMRMCGYQLPSLAV